MARTVIYDKSAGELSRLIDCYFQNLREHPDVRGGPCDFLAHVGLTMELAAKLTQTPPEAYKEHAKLLKMAAVRLRAHLETSPAWSNSSSSKSIYLTKQTLWDGKAYTDKQEIAATGSATICVKFGTAEGGKPSGAEAEAFD